jgi:hypothetical protein
MSAVTQHTKISGFDYRTPDCISALGCIREMLAAVEFNDELGGVANKVDDVVSDRSLSSKSKPVQPMVS